MTTVTRWGIVATGRIAHDFVTDLALVSDAEVVAVASRSADSAEVFAADHGIAKAYGSWADLAADPDVDVVYVATPHSAHHAATKLMLEAGKPVLCEKPFTMTAAGAQDLFDTAAAHGVLVAEAMWMRVNPAILRAVELVEAGEIGEVRAVHADFGIQAPDDNAHRLRNPALGGGALLDLGVYPVSFAEIFLGTPTSVQATARLTDLGVDETTGILLGYANGAHAALTCSITADSPVGGTIIGSTGSIEMHPLFFRAQGLTLRRHGRAELVEDLSYEGGGLRFQAIEVAECVRGGLRESPVLSHDGTMSVMSTMDQVRAQIGVSYPPDLL